MSGSSDCFCFLPSCPFYSHIRMRWQREHNPPSQICHFLAIHSTLGEVSAGVHSLKCWFRDPANQQIKIQFPRPPPPPPGSRTLEAAPVGCTFQAPSLLIAALNTTWHGEKSPLLKML